MIDEFLKERLPQVIELCKVNNVLRLYAFGSIVDGRFVKGKSDIDLLVEFDPSNLSKKDRSRNMLKLWIQLQAILESKVDLISNENIEGEHFKKYLELYKTKIFDSSEKEG